MSVGHLTVSPTAPTKDQGAPTMCRAHRLTIAFTAALWVVALALIVFAPAEGQWRMAIILTGCLAVVMVPYSLFPWMVAGLLDERLKDFSGAYLAGWQAAQEQQGEPDEPTRLHAVG